ncbi:ABC transporter permease [Acaricomes phytoseiuli]|uniref:FtsX-like permease family protein n=1 Tax=Acaricomes phytoseiuli TaxID=291968 RepID=UPI00222380BB|nr:ABC transporter permease [Acaricomes phytoseiuli]MCW1250466.1 ABC transporter permease [Acaricomes phytoseiuli]
MLQIALSQIRLNYRRFIAIGLAVVLAVAFLVSTLILSASTQATLKASIGESYAKADVVITPPVDKGFNQAAVEAISAIGKDGGTKVTAVYPVLNLVAQAQSNSSAFTVMLRNTPENQPMEARELNEGVLPSAPGQIAIDESTARQQSLELGSEMIVSILGVTGGITSAAPPEESGAPEPELATQRMEVVGIVSEGTDPLAAGTSTILASTQTVAELSPLQPLTYSSIQLALDDPMDASTRIAISDALSQAGVDGSIVRSADEQVNATLSGLTKEQDILTQVLLSFVEISLVVAALVVSNTFAVLVAQRTRELALLRCLGAKRGQIRSSVILEATLVGLFASLFGVGLGVGGMYAATAAARQIPGQEFATFSMNWSTPVAGVVVGVLLAVVAALAPARAATAVAPLAALRPAEDVALTNRRGRIRLILGLILLVLGSLLLVLGAAVTDIAIALPGGLLSFLGILFCGTLFLPKLVAWVGRLAAPTGVPGSLAALNAIRNPGRTTTTASALLIGVTLVSLMLTGASTSRAAFVDSLDKRYPVDISVAPGAYSDRAMNTVAGMDGVEATAQLPVVGTATIDSVSQPVLGISSADIQGLLSNPGNRPANGQILVPEGTLVDTVTVTTTDNGQQTLPAATAASRDLPLLVSTDTLPAPSASEGGTRKSGLWLKLNPAADATQIQDLRKQIAATLRIEEFQISSAALAKESFNQVIDILLIVVMGLLAVAVLIALIGVANTLSLSVLERTRENALLRALGLTRRALRGMLAYEAVLIAVVAALVGAGLGAVYGWLGAQAALGKFATVSPEIPWLQLVLVVAIAAIAGLAASVLPARRAAKLSPVEGLATE